jgi:Cu2+-exporting ATPase
LLLLEGHALETLGSARTFVFDKTGTLTEGRPQVRIDWGDISLQDRAGLAAIALGLEAHQPHPFAVAMGLALQDVFPGLTPAQVDQRITHLASGVEGMVAGVQWRIGKPSFVAQVARHPPVETSSGGEAWLGDGHGIRVRFHFVDAPRSGAAALIEGLRQDGVRIALLSGDQPAAVAVLAQHLGISEARGGLSPEDKLAAVRALQSAGPVVMVGDGLNDAPGFGAADLAVAVGRVTQALARGAGAIVPDGDLASLAAGVHEARGALRRVRQNLAWALLYNLCAIPLAAGGWLTPWEAGLGMSLSSLLVVVNGMRPWKS